NLLSSLPRWNSDPVQLSLPLPRARVGLDPILCMAAVTLLTWGLVMVASASIAQAQKVAGDPFYFFWRQLAFAGAGGLIGWATFLVPMHVWERKSGWLAVLGILLLLVVLIPGIGIKVNSARRWIDLEVFRLQASEPARLALIMYLAGYIVRRQAKLQNTFSGVLVPLIPLAVAAVLLLLEPDFGATVILFGVAFVMLFLGGARLLHIGVLALSGVAALGLIAVAAPYRMRRLLNFTNPFDDVEGGGWQLANSLIAVGRGEWTGVGLGSSVQKLLYLPEMHTDFIFAILAEEFGLLGILTLIALFGVVVWRGFVIGARADARNERFKACLVYGLTIWLGLQALINMGVNLGALPTKGLTLPLLSYGGSSLITVLCMLALILRVDYENRLAFEKVRSPRA
ncbi:MAG TPA: putative lipid II flippase FtsW, partial [Nevskiaceae bacterium]|nr:putative lipid II flippase FtsW [Nevskiaceae bacterium]